MKIPELRERLRNEGYTDDQYWIGGDDSWDHRYEYIGLRRWSASEWELFYSERGVGRTLDRFDKEDDAAAGLYRALTRESPRPRCIAFIPDKQRTDVLAEALRRAGLEPSSDSIQYRMGVDGIRYRVFVPALEFERAKTLRDEMGSGWVPDDWETDRPYCAKPTVREPAPEHATEAAEVDRLATADLRKVYRPTSLALRHRDSAHPKAKPLVATVDEHVVGTVQYRVVAERLSVQSLGVHPKFRRKGIARALITHLEKIARASACKALELHTVRETGNVEVFERMGFEVVTEGPTELFESDEGSPLHEVVMRKAFSEGA